MSTPVLTPNGDYLDRLMRRESYQALWPLFAKATKPAKEMTESFSALEHLRPMMRKTGKCRVLHVGDGAHARTAALFALKTDADNISIDPIINEGLVRKWRDEFSVKRFQWRRARIGDEAASLNELSVMPVFVSFVHAHVGVEAELARLKWDAAFTLACCLPGKQLARKLTPFRAGEDMSVLSSDRTYQILVNPQSEWATRFTERS